MKSTPAARKKAAQFKLQKKRWQGVIGGPAPKQLCLCMIVKDEEHIILETLRHLVQVISFDAYCIVDTGSTDKTRELIKTFFSKECPTIPGQLLERTWRDFGYNRTEALHACYGASKFIFMFDADDLILGTWPKPNWNDLWNENVDSVNVFFGTGDEGLHYWRQTVFRNDGHWGYQGVLHEYPWCSKAKPVMHKLKPLPDTTYWINSRRLGSRNKNPNKYRDDALKLIKVLKTEPNNHRYIFYAAQSWFDANQFQNAMDWYRRRVKVGGWVEEKWYSQFRIGECHSRLQNPAKAVEAFHAALGISPHRYEALHKIMMLHRASKNWSASYELIKNLTIPIPYPEEDLLFINTAVYDHQLYEEMMECAYEAKDFLLAGRTASHVLKHAKQLTAAQRDRITANLKVFLAPPAPPPPPPPPSVVVEPVVLPAPPPPPTAVEITPKPPPQVQQQQQQEPLKWENVAGDGMVPLPPLPVIAKAPLINGKLLPLQQETPYVPLPCFQGLRILQAADQEMPLVAEDDEKNRKKRGAEIAPEDLPVAIIHPPCRPRRKKAKRTSPPPSSSSLLWIRVALMGFLVFSSMVFVLKQFT